MSQVTWRAADELVERVRQAAAQQGLSLNEYLTRLAEAATDPALAGSAAERGEVPAALWRKQRTGELSVSDAAVLVAAFEADYVGTDGEKPRFAVVAADARVLEAAARLVGTHGLRAYEGVQLASACLARGAVDGRVVFLAFDEALCAAAAAEGLSLAEAV